MANSRIKKVIVLKNNLPAVGPNNDYLVRYRIVSEDKNRYSHWSHLWKLQAHDVVGVGGYVELSENRITVMWDNVFGYDDKNSYDVLIKVDGGDWELKDSTKSTSSTFLRPNIETQLDVAVQVESYLKVYSSDLVIFEDTVMV